MCIPVPGVVQFLCGFLMSCCGAFSCILGVLSKFCSVQRCDHRTREKESWLLGWLSAGLFIFCSFTFYYSPSWCRKRSAIFDCGTPWISFHSFLLKSLGHSLNVLIFDDCSQKN